MCLSVWIECPLSVDLRIGPFVSVTGFSFAKYHSTPLHVTHPRTTKIIIETKTKTNKKKSPTNPHPVPFGLQIPDLNNHCDLDSFVGYNYYQLPSLDVGGNKRRVATAEATIHIFQANINPLVKENCRHECVNAWPIRGDVCVWGTCR